MGSKFLEPSAHAFHLVLVFPLSGAFINIAFSPFAVTRGDLLDTTDRVSLLSVFPNFCVGTLSLAPLKLIIDARRGTYVVFGLFYDNRIFIIRFNMNSDTKFHS